MSEQTCSTCIHSNPNPLGERGLRCRVEPPKAFPMPTQHGVAVMTIWPTVQENDLCGRWQTSMFKGTKAPPIKLPGT